MASLTATLERHARRRLPTGVRRIIQLATGVRGRRGYAARWLMFPLLRHLTPAVMVRDGRVRLLVWTRDQVIPRMIYAGREGDSVQLAQALSIVAARSPLAADLTFVDVGANIGNAGLAALASGRFARVVAFEPDPRSLALLRANVALNDRADRVEIVAAGASDVDDEHAILALNPRNFGDNVIVSADATGVPADGAAQPTALVRLDRVLPATPGFRPEDAFYWIDIQGHEARALSGLGPLLDLSVGVVIELSPGHASPDAFAEIAARLARGHRWFARLGRDSGDPRPTDELVAFAAEVHRVGEIADIVVFGPTGAPRV